MVLLHILHTLGQKESWRLIVAHLNHRLRGRASQADERFVKETAKKLGVCFVTKTAEVRKAAEKQKVSIEMAARKLRHDFLAKQAQRFKCDTIALAHHADDQLELFFLRLLRGSGGEGLAGMRWKRPSPSDQNITLARPFLDLPRSALETFATRHSIRFRQDATNNSLEFQRNRIRHELLPLLRQHYQKSLDKVILRIAEIVRAEADFTTQCALEWLHPTESPNRGGSGSEVLWFKTPVPFEQLPVALQRRIVQLQGPKIGLALDFDKIEKLRLNPGKSVNCSGNLSDAIYVSCDRSGQLYPVQRAETSFQSTSQRLMLSNNSGRTIFDGLEIQWRKEPGRTFPKGVLGCEYFDADKVGHCITLRHWRAGDRFCPIGMKDLVKLQDFFINEKIPRDKRRSLVIAVAETGEVFWVEGLRISNNFRISNKTKKRLKWSWRRQAGPGSSWHGI
jgi:tRNA(Ile)-lysidine synthase